MAVMWCVSISDLPAVNASLNFVSAIFISSGWYLIRRGYWREHIACMIAALTASTGFLVGYLVYHAHVGEHSSHFSATGIVRPIYFTLLITHILLAFVTLPLVIATLVPVFRRTWEKHRAIARWTMPIWLYVSVTGVLVYLMLYRWFAPAP
jgi:putative membrane protein